MPWDTSSYEEELARPAARARPHSRRARPARRDSVGAAFQRSCLSCSPRVARDLLYEDCMLWRVREPPWHTRVHLAVLNRVVSTVLPGTVEATTCVLPTFFLPNTDLQSLVIRQ